MGIVFRQSMLTSIISYAGVVVGYVNLLYLYPKFLSLDQVGLLRAIQDAAMLMVPFATFGLSSGIVRFFPQHAKSPEQSKAFVSLMVTLGASGFIVFLLLFVILQPFLIPFFEENATAVIHSKNLILTLTLLLLFMTLFEQFSKAILQVAFPNFVREVGIRVMQSILVVGYFYSIINFDQFIVASVLIYLVALTVLLLFLFRHKLGFHFAGMATFSFAKLKEIVTYSSLSFVSISAMIIIGKMDSMMVTGMLGLPEVAVYTTAFYMATVIEIPKRAITQTATTVLARAFEKKQIIEIDALYKKTANNQFIIGALLLIGIWANLDNMFTLMPKGEEFRAGANVVLLVGLAKLIDMAFGPSSEIIGLSKYYWFNLVVVTLLAGSVVAANYMLIPRMGMEGAAFGSVIALVGYNLIKFVFIYRKLKLQPFTINTIKVIMIIAATVVLNLVMPKLENIFIDVAYRSVAITIVFGGLILVSRSSAEIYAVVNKGLQWVRAARRK